MGNFWIALLICVSFSSITHAQCRDLYAEYSPLGFPSLASSWSSPRMFREQGGLDRTATYAELAAFAESSNGAVKLDNQGLRSGRVRLEAQVNDGSAWSVRQIWEPKKGGSEEWRLLRTVRSLRHGFSSNSPFANLWISIEQSRVTPEGKQLGTRFDEYLFVTLGTIDRKDRKKAGLASTMVVKEEIINLIAGRLASDPRSIETDLPWLVERLKNRIAFKNSEIFGPEGRSRTGTDPAKKFLQAIEHSFPSYAGTLYK